MSRHKYGIFLHPQTPNPQLVLEYYLTGLLDSFVDGYDSGLGATKVSWSFDIVRVDDSVVFSVEHSPERYTVFEDDQSGPVRSGIKEALDWWNGDTVLITPSEYTLSWNGGELPNAWTRPWENGLVVQNITQYPKRLGWRVLEEWNPGLLYVPFLFFYEPPEREAELAAQRRWWDEREAEVKTALEGQSWAPGRGWFFTRALRYRNTLAPDASVLRPVGTLEEAEAEAVVYRGPCFLIDATTGKRYSRWAER